MDGPRESLVKEREIAFCTLHPDPHQATSAAELLAATDGVQGVDVLGPGLIQVSYQLLVIRLIDIEILLEHNGFHLDNRLVLKIKRALYYYTEDAQRLNLGCSKGENNCTQKVFASHYGKREHGCQDHRPEHWRQYR